MIQFICGCLSKLEAPIHPETFKTFDSVVIDDEGFMVCMTHHARRKGWRSLPTTGGKPDYSFSSWTPHEIERFIYWAEIPAPRAVALLATNTEDRRDNRDPVILGNEILAKANGA